MFRTLLALVALLVLLETAAASPVWLTINRTGKGSGGVVSVQGPQAVNCGILLDGKRAGPADCRVSIGKSNNIRLRAAPHPGSRLASWVLPEGYGTCSGNDVFCLVQSREEDFQITVVFEPNTESAIYINDVDPNPGSTLPLTVPTVNIQFNTQVIFLQAVVYCSDNHVRRVVPVALDNVGTTAGASVWRCPFPEDDPVPLGASCTLHIPSSQAVIPKDRDDIFGVVDIRDQGLYIFNPDATLPSGGYVAHFKIVDPRVEITTAERRAETVTTIVPNAALTSAVTVTVASTYRALLPTPNTLSTSGRISNNHCLANVVVLASGINLYMVAGHPENAEVDGKQTQLINFDKQTKYIITRSDNSQRQIHAFTTLPALTTPQQCYLLAKEVRIAKRDLSAELNTEDSIVLLGTITQELIPWLAPPASPPPSVAPSPVVDPSPTSSESPTPSPTTPLQWLVCAGTCRCPMTTTAARCVSDLLVAATVPGCNNPCVPSTTPSPTPSTSFSPSTSPTTSATVSASRTPSRTPTDNKRKKRIVPQGQVFGLMDVHTGISDLIVGSDVAITTSVTALNTIGLPLGFAFAGKSFNIQFLNSQNNPTRRFGVVDVGINARTLLFGGPSDVMSNYVLFAQSARSSRSWDAIPFTVDADSRLSFSYSEPYEDFMFARRVAIPSPNNSDLGGNNGKTAPRNGATSGGSTTLFNDLTEPNDPTYGPVTPPTQYIGNFVPTPVPLVDNPFFTDRTFRLSPASVSLPSILLVAVTAVLAMFL